MSDLDVGSTVLVKGIVTHEGIKIGGQTLPASDVDVVSDMPRFVGIVNPLPLILFFSDEQDRADFAQSYMGLPGLELREIDNPV